MLSFIDGDGDGDGNDNGNGDNNGDGNGAVVYWIISRSRSDAFSILSSNIIIDNIISACGAFICHVLGFIYFGHWALHQMSRCIFEVWKLATNAYTHHLLQLLLIATYSNLYETE